MNTKIYPSNVRKRIRRIQRKMLRIAKHKRPQWVRNRLPAMRNELYWAFYCGLRSLDRDSVPGTLVSGQAALLRDAFLHNAAARMRLVVTSVDRERGTLTVESAL